MKWRKTGQDQYESGPWLIYKGARKPPKVGHYVMCWHIHREDGLRTWEDTLAEAQSWCAAHGEP